MGYKKSTIFAALFTMLLGVAGVQAQISRANERQIGPLLQRLETRTDAFSTAIERQLDNGRIRNGQREENVRDYVEAFENATDELRSNFNGRRVQNEDVSKVLNYGWYLNDFMNRNRMNAATVQQWNLVRTDLNTLARLYSVSWNWNQRLPVFTRGPVQDQVQYIRVDERQVRPILQRLETRTDAFSRAVDRRLDNSNANSTQTEDDIMAYVEAFENATDELRRDFDGQTVELADVTKVLNYGWYVNDFMSRIRMNRAAVQHWTLIRNDLNTLSRLYNVSWNWNQRLPAFSQNQGQWGSQQNNQLSGTYRLNVGASDNVSNVIAQTIRNTSVRAQQQANLERRMASPQTIVFQTSGNQVRFATDYGAPVDLVADGRAITETNNRGQQIRTTVSMTGNALSIMTDGDRSNDYRVSFIPVGGNRLRVTRQLYLENQNEMITVNSFYDRTSEVASWPTVNQPVWNTPTNSGNFYIPNGTQLTAVLQNRVATNVSQAGDMFSMEVTSPNQYRGAVITGRIAQVESSGRVSGRANLAMEFESIRFGNQTYQFAGIIDSAREADGEVININNEGSVRDGNQTTRTVTRAGIGAVLGALIGAIAGGGSGAAIGAGVGAGAGAGTVLIQGRDNLQLEQGSEFMITASAPANLGVR